MSLYAPVFPRARISRSMFSVLKLVNVNVMERFIPYPLRLLPCSQMTAELIVTKFSFNLGREIRMITLRPLNF